MVVETELSNVEAIDNVFEITRRVPLWRRTVGTLLRFIVFFTNLQPLAKLRIYLDTFDVASLLIIIIFNIIVFFSLCSGKCLSHAFAGQVKDLSKQIGSLAQYNFMLILLPVARRTIILPYLGIPTNRLIMFHKWLGRWIFVLLVVHGALFTYYYAQKSWHTVWKEFTKTDILFGELSTLCVFILVFFSLRIFRRKLYELFMKSHYIAFILSIIFACLHKKGDQMIALCSFSIAIYGLDLLIRFFKLAISRYPVKYKLISPDFVELTVEGLTRYNPGEYVYLWIPRISPIEMHPFSISSIPESGAMTIIIKADGNWTKRLARHPVSHIWIEGRYSAGTIPTTFYPRLIMVAGGVGITPFISMIKSIRERNLKNPDNLTYVDLIWTSSTLDLYSHFYSDLIDLMADQSIRIHLYYTGKEDILATMGDQCSKEFADSISAVRVNVNDHLNIYAKQLPQFANVGVLSCGPASLIKATARACSFPRKKCIFVHHSESFGI